MSRDLKKPCVSLAALVLFAMGGTTVCAQPAAAASDRAAPRHVLVIHGGAGVPPRAQMTPEKEAACRADLERSLRAGHEVLLKGGTSIAAVEAAIRVLEDSPLFNAGKGASFNSAGANELDSAIMDGRTLEAGGVAIVQGVKNPITLARLVMERSPHVLIASDGAQQFAREQGVEMVPPHYFFTQRKWDSLQKRLREGAPYGRTTDAENMDRTTSLDSLDRGAFGTVGAVALDQAGNLAAGTSTGGREGKLPGRIGDSPIIGAGTYANNATLAASSTGLGEYVMRVVGTKDMSDLMEYRGWPLERAVRSVNERIKAMGGNVGVISVDRRGHIATHYTGDGMYRGFVREDGKTVVHIYGE